MTEQGDQEVLEEMLTKKEHLTEFDAVHPRFREEDPVAVKEFQIKNDYYCASCDQFFAPTVLGLKTHFKGDMVQHRSIGNCYYCSGDVFEYTINNQRQLYHNCSDYRKKQ